MSYRYALVAIVYNHVEKFLCGLLRGHRWFTSTEGSTWCSYCIAKGES